MTKKYLAFPKHQTFNGLLFCRDDKTGYYKHSCSSSSKSPIYLHRTVWESVYGSIPKGFDIHHKDFDKSNNSIDNLEMLSTKDHLELHGRMLSETQKRYLCSRKSDECLAKAAEWHRSEEGRGWHRNHAANCKSNGSFQPKKVIIKCDCCGKVVEKIEGSRFCCFACKAKWRRLQKLDYRDYTCSVCGKTYSNDRFREAHRDIHFCSRACAAIHIGKAKTEAFIAKMLAHPELAQNVKNKWWLTKEGIEKRMQFNIRKREKRLAITHLTDDNHL